MKKIIFCAAILLSFLAYKPANAQIKISLGLNIGSQPDWGPVGYDHADYYYMPDIDSYYDVSAHQYVYMQNNSWIHANTLPAKYSNYDLYNGYKVVVNQRNPWQNQASIRAKYANYKGRRGQAVIRDSHDKKYASHWQGDNHGSSHGAPSHDNGQSHGAPAHGNDKGHDDHGHGRP
jgi:hypothetical protein